MRTECKNCGKEFTRPRSWLIRRKNHYCSRSCQSGGVPVVCMNCGKEFRRIACWIKTHKKHYCSKKCSAEGRIKPPHNFWDMVDFLSDPEGCWPWQRAQSGGGYGHCRVGYKDMYAHRIAYKLTFGEIPVGLNINHKCHNPLCCNPDHIYAGTAKDNTADMIAAGRAYWQKN